MNRVTRRTVLATMGALSIGGCVSGPRSGIGTDPSATSQPPTDTPDVGGVETGTGFTPAVDQSKADHAVYLENRSTRERTIRIEVVRRATGEAVFDETQAIAPDTEREVYNLERANPDGIEAFAICGHATDATATPGTDDGGSSETPDHPQRDCITMRTDACHGTAHVAVDEGGDLRVIYSIC